ncbi:MAG: GspE/PulE family protein [Victivallales bacterium]|nr:GspE/PulE family protein [bacterium]MDD7752079.1 GspE/PulE family protein [bacterium]MDY5697014.1 GspE/PulE family protein [Victivallales bacterium]
MEDIVFRKTPPPEIDILDSRGKSVLSLDDASYSESLEVMKELIFLALKKRASDIFIDPKKDSVYTVRLRVDGGLRMVRTLDDTLANAVISAIKVAAGMDSFERRRPQDGSFTARVPEGQAAFRVASVGAFGGEKITVRVLGCAGGPMKLEDLGMTLENQKMLKSVLGMPSGMLLICGPTGSGKTTTLYGILQSFDYSIKNIMSIEDPIENIMPNISQMEVNTKAEITFAALLRNALRQNPDVICLGEIRDRETAEIATQAAQTGHFIVATLHSNDNIGTLDRMMSLGVPMRSLASTLRMIVSQRLVRKLCSCKQRTTLPEEYREYFEASGWRQDQIYAPCGCRECDGTGYKERHAIFEMMPMTTELKALLENGESLSEVKEFLEQQNGSSSMMLNDALRLVERGETSIDEVERVILKME